MTVKELSVYLSADVLSLPDPEREVKGVYIGDLLSWVMGRAKEADTWITIMSNINVVAVASLSDTACVILAEGVRLDTQVINTAEKKGVNILSSDKSAYEIAVALQSVI